MHAGLEPTTVLLKHFFPQTRRGLTLLSQLCILLQEKGGYMPSGPITTIHEHEVAKSKEFMI